MAAAVHLLIYRTTSGDCRLAEKCAHAPFADDDEDRRGAVRSSLAKELTFFEKVKGR
jgi:hypothetical protein